MNLESGALKSYLNVSSSFSSLNEKTSLIGFDGSSARNEPIFELNSKEVGNRIVNEIRRKLSVLEPRINNIQIRVDGEPDTSELDVTVFYNITNGLQNQGVNFTVSRVR